MKQHSGKIKVYCFSSLFFALLVAGVYSAAYLLSFEPDIGYFVSADFLPFFARALNIAALLWIFSIYITVPKVKNESTQNPHALPSRIAAGVCAAAFAAYALCRFIMLPTIHDVSPVLSLVCILLGALCSLFFVLAAWLPDLGSTAAVGFIPIFWAAIAMTEIYTDKYIAINNPMKIAFMLSMISIMLFMLYELRYLLGRGMPRAFVVFTLTGIMLTASFSLPSIMMTITGMYPLTEFLLPAVISLFFCIYMVTRLFDLLATLRGESENTQTEKK